MTQFDASVMCRRLSDYLCGHRKALSIVHIPSPEEEARRAQGRLREQLRLHLARMRAMGRSLLLQRELVVKGRWWTPANWQRIEAQMPPWVRAQLELWKKIITLTERELARLEASLAGSPILLPPLVPYTAASAAAPKQLFVGEGELSHELIARELIDPHRFKNGRQVGNYFGLCPSESSSGEKRRLGAITKHGSPPRRRRGKEGAGRWASRLRRLMIQLAWRVVIFQPQYRGMQRWQSVLGLGVAKTSGAARKKAIVALARQLAVDLWRIATGRSKAEDVGLVLRPNAH